MTQKSMTYTFQCSDRRSQIHLHEEFSWYPMALSSISMMARHYITRGGRIYDLGRDIGDVGRILSPVLREKDVHMVALTECADKAATYCGPGKVIMADILTYPYKLFDVAIACMTLTNFFSQERASLLASLRKRLRPGGAIILMDRMNFPEGNPAIRTVLFGGRHERGACSEPDKRVFLAVDYQRYRNELGKGAVEMFRFGAFVGWLIEG